MAKVDIELPLEAARELFKNQPEMYDKFVDIFNKKIKEVEKEEETEDDEPKQKAEWQYYDIFDKTQGEEPGTSPMLTIKVNAEISPMDIEANIQEAITNFHNQNRGKKKRKSRLVSFLDLARVLKKSHFVVGKEVKFVSKEPTIPLGVQLDLEAAK